MAITGSYLAQNTYTGAEKWGSGYNPIHSINWTAGRSDKDPNVAQGPGGEHSSNMPEEMLDLAVPEYGYTDEEFSSSIYGYGPETGTSDRPGVDVSTQQLRGDVPFQWPAALNSDPGPPGGDVIRRDDHGAEWIGKAKLGDKEETVSEGWQNKAVAGVADSVDSDTTQLYMQTSQVQRDKVRKGSQAQPGRASEYTAPIGSWRPTWGMRVKPWSGYRRHYDMVPREQNQYFRAFWYRQAGTGIIEQMEPNEAWNYQHEPLQRQPVNDPYAGTEIPRPGNVYDEESSNVSSWVDVWY